MASEELKLLSESNTAFGNALYSQLTPIEAEHNFVLSPFSLSAVLTMALQGARARTARQMREALRLNASLGEEALNIGYSELMSGLNNASSAGIELSTANRIYVDSSLFILKTFEIVLDKFYSAEAANVDFTHDANLARHEINKWVEHQTRSKIKELLPASSVSSDTRMVLVNAVYFRGQWAQKFDAKSTKKEDFFVYKHSKVKVDMMHQSAQFRSGMHFKSNTKVLELPYKGNRLAMLIFLPEEEGNFARTEKAITSEEFRMKDVRLGRMSKTIVALPKFKIESSHSLRNAIIELGASDMFEEKRADFSGITGGADLMASGVYQKAFLEVSEEGSEAAAASGMTMVFRSAEMPNEFICNRPFIFRIVDNLTNSTLFIGKLFRPDSK